MPFRWWESFNECRLLTQTRYICPRLSTFSFSFFEHFKNLVEVTPVCSICQVISKWEVIGVKTRPWLISEPDLKSLSGLRWLGDLLINWMAWLTWHVNYCVCVGSWGVLVGNKCSCVEAKWRGDCGIKNNGFIYLSNIMLCPDGRCSKNMMRMTE